MILSGRASFFPLLPPPLVSLQQPPHPCSSVAALLLVLSCTGYLDPDLLPGSFQVFPRLVSACWVPAADNPAVNLNVAQVLPASLTCLLGRLQVDPKLPQSSSVIALGNLAALTRGYLFSPSASLPSPALSHPGF